VAEETTPPLTGPPPRSSRTEPEPLSCSFCPVEDVEDRRRHGAHAASKFTRTGQPFRKETAKESIPVGMMQWGENPRRTRGGLDPDSNALEAVAPSWSTLKSPRPPGLPGSLPTLAAIQTRPAAVSFTSLLADQGISATPHAPSPSAGRLFAFHQRPPRARRRPEYGPSPLRLVSPPREDICRTPLLRVAVRGQGRQGDLAGGSSALSCLLLLTNGTRQSVARARTHTHGHGHCTLSPVLRAPGKPHAPTRQTGKQPDSPVLIARSSYRQSGG
jgi:hypothetical protein